MVFSADYLYKPYIVITGTIRDPLFLAKRLDFFYALKREGLISNIIFSTWTGEVDQHPEIRESLIYNTCIVVETDEPTLVCRGHYVHQMMALQNALQACPDDCFIFKTRTDKAGIDDGFIEEQVYEFFLSREYIKPLMQGETLFQYKIATLQQHTNLSLGFPVLFFWLDRMYFGYKKDILKFINFNVTEFDFLNIIPEQSFFSHPFSYCGNYFKEFFLHVNQGDFIEKIIFSPERPSLDKMFDFMVNNSFFVMAFLWERVILHRFFFDIESSNDIPFLTVFRGVELGRPSHLYELFDRMNTRRLNAGLNELSQARDFRDFLSSDYGIINVGSAVSETGLGIHFSMPSNSLKVK